MGDVGEDGGVAGAVGDEQQDLESFCRAAYPELVGVLQLRGHPPHRAEELAQDALVKVVEHWSRVSKMENPRGWAMRTALNRGTSSWRRLTVERRALGRVGAAPSTNGDRPHDQGTVDRLTVRDAVRRLPPRQRDTVILRHYVGLSVEEVADVLRCSQGTVKSNTHKAVASLRAAGLVSDEGAADHA